MDSNTVSKDNEAVQLGPSQVPRIDKQTFPFEYKFGLKRTVPFEVVLISALGDENG